MDPGLGQACEALQKQLLRQLLGVRKTVTWDMCDTTLAG